MRGARRWAGAGAICLALLPMAAAALEADGTPPAISDYKAGQFASDLRVFITQVRTQYVREISNVDLFYAALSGLHEAAKVPVPANLRNQLLALQKDLDAGNAENDYAQLITQLRKNLGDVPALAESRDMIASVRALNRVLDPYCGFTNERDSRSADEERYSTGIQFDNLPRPSVEQEVNGDRNTRTERKADLGAVPHTLLIKAVVPGSPGHQAGLRPGDVISKIDDRPCAELEWRQLYRIFFPMSAESGNGDPPRIHKLEFRRPALNIVRECELVPQEFFVPESVFGISRTNEFDWNYSVSSEGLCYARIGPIRLSTPSELQTLLAEMEAKKYRGLILDLRWCPGGFLTPAQAVARSFLSHDDPIARIQYRSRTDTDEHEDRVERYPNLPLLVLVNGETMGGGELIAAALQSYHRATIAGERTFGKATVQRSLERNPLGIPYRISVGEFLTPDSKKLQRYPDSKPSDDWGVRPDAGRWIPMSPELSKQLKEWWTWHSLRPAGSKDALPTDDPMVDPQLKAAMQMLRQMTAKPES